MGVIQKQALRSSIASFLGAGVGAISRLSMPLLISESQIGLLQLLDSISGVFVSVFNFGFGQVLARLFPRYRNPANGHHGFLAFGLSLSLMGVVFSSIIYYFFW